MAAASSDGGLHWYGGPDKERKGLRGPRPEKVTGDPDGCVTPLTRMMIIKDPITHVKFSIENSADHSDDDDDDDDGHDNNNNNNDNNNYFTNS